MDAVCAMLWMWAALLLSPTPIPDRRIVISMHEHTAQWLPHDTNTTHEQQQQLQYSTPPPHTSHVDSQLREIVR